MSAGVTDERILVSAGVTDEKNFGTRSGQSHSLPIFDLLVHDAPKPFRPAKITSTGDVLKYQYIRNDLD